MAKLRGKAKEEFLKRMAKGRRKAKPRAKKKHAATRPKRAAAKNTAKKNPAKRRKNRAKLTGKAKAEFLKRMAKGRRKAGRANPKRKRTTASRKTRARTNPLRRRRRNQEDSMTAAVAKFEEFHGKQPGRIVEYEDTYTYPANLAEMGRLLELRFKLDSYNKDVPLNGFKGTQAVCTPDGHNIYFVGGDQRIDLAALGIETDKDRVELGECHQIEYHTVKGFHSFAPTDYHHKFGEESGIKPTLSYDRLNKTLFLSSGAYQVRPEGIRD